VISLLSKSDKYQPKHLCLLWPGIIGFISIIWMFSELRFGASFDSILINFLALI